jgi:hypothetical protein
MDDFFGWDFEDNCIQFHSQLRPRRQVQLLLLWDFISCPYEDKKQEHGTLLKIIGFWVNSLLGSISLSPDSIQDLVLKIKQFINTSDRQPPLRDWLKLAGHLNWSISFHGVGQPSLSYTVKPLGKHTPVAKSILMQRSSIIFLGLPLQSQTPLESALLILGSGMMMQPTLFCGLMQVENMASLSFSQGMDLFINFTRLMQKPQLSIFSSLNSLPSFQEFIMLSTLLNHPVVSFSSLIVSTL